MSEVKKCCHKTKKRTEKEYKDLLNRLSRIEGQVRGLSLIHISCERTNALQRVDSSTGDRNRCIDERNKIL